MPNTTTTMAAKPAIGVIVLLLLASALPASAQTSTSTNQGREFWVVFQTNFRDHVIDPMTMNPSPAYPLTLELEISAATTAKGYVEIPSLRFRRDFVVPPGLVLRISIDTAAQLRGSEAVQKLGVHVVADAPITLTGLNRRYQSTDTWLGLPVETLGTTYRAAGYAWLQEDLLSQLAVVATEDATDVKITPSVTTSGGRSETFMVRLDRGDVYQVMAKFDPSTTSDLTGTLVTSTKPVAMFSGHNCAYVPDTSVKACNPLYEQLLPVDRWGMDFVIVPLADRGRSRYRVVASQENTGLWVDGEQITTLNAGGYHEADLTGAIMLAATRPVMVMQYSTGYNDETAPRPLFTRQYYYRFEDPPVDSAAIRRDEARQDSIRQSLRQRGIGIKVDPSGQKEDVVMTRPMLREKRQYQHPVVESSDIGDPMMLLVPATTAYLSDYRIHTPVQGNWHHFINVIAPAAAVETLRIDGRAVDVDNVALTRLFRPVGSSGWFSAQIEIADGAHHITASQPVGIYQYGFTAYDAYGNSAGGDMRVREQK